MSGSRTAGLSGNCWEPRRSPRPGPLSSALSDRSPWSTSRGWDALTPVPGSSASRLVAAALPIPGLAPHYPSAGPRRSRRARRELLDRGERPAESGGARRADLVGDLDAPICARRAEPSVDAMRAGRGWCSRRARLTTISRLRCGLVSRLTRWFVPPRIQRVGPPDSTGPGCAISTVLWPSVDLK